MVAWSLPFWAVCGVALDYELRGEARLGVTAQDTGDPRMKREFVAWGDGEHWQIKLWNTNLLRVSEFVETTGTKYPVKRLRTSTNFSYWVMGGANGEASYFGRYDFINTNSALILVTSNTPPEHFDRLSGYVWLLRGQTIKWFVLCATN
jgi:hypothetical protein